MKPIPSPTVTARPRPGDVASTRTSGVPEIEGQFTVESSWAGTSIGRSSSLSIAESSSTGIERMFVCTVLGAIGGSGNDRLKAFRKVSAE